MSDDRHKSSGNTMACTVNHSYELQVTIIVHPVKVTAHNIFGHEKNKRFLKCIFLWKHCPLYAFCISDTCGYISVFLFDLLAFLNYLCGSYSVSYTHLR